MAVKITLSLEDRTSRQLDELIDRVERASESVEGLGDSGKRLGKDFDGVTQATAQYQREMSNATKSTEQLQQQTTAGSRATRDLNSAIREVETQAVTASKAHSSAAHSLVAYTAGATGGGIATKALSAAVKATTTVLKPLASTVVAAGVAWDAHKLRLEASNLRLSAATKAVSQFLRGGRDLQSVLGILQKVWKNNGNSIAAYQVALRGQLVVEGIARAHALGFGIVMKGVGHTIGVVGRIIQGIEAPFKSFGLITRGVSDSVRGLSSRILLLEKLFQAVGKKAKSLTADQQDVADATDQASDATRRATDAAGGSSAAFGALGVAVLGAVAGVKALQSAAKTMEDFASAVEFARVHTGESTEEVLKQAKSLRVATGNALSLAESLRLVAKASQDGSLSATQQLQLIQVATIEAKRRGEEVGSFSQRVFDAIRTGGADSLAQMGLLSGGIEVVKARFDELRGAPGAFDELTDAQKRAVVQAELLAETAAKSKNIQTIGEANVSAVDKLKGAFADAYLAFSRGLGSGGPSVILANVAATIRSHVIPFVEGMSQGFDHFRVVAARAIGETLEKASLLARFILIPIRHVTQFAHTITSVFGLANNGLSDLIGGLDSVVDSSEKYLRQFDSGFAERQVAGLKQEIALRAQQAKQRAADTKALDERIAGEKLQNDQLRKANEELLRRKKIQEQVAKIGSELGLGGSRGGGGGGFAAGGFGGGGSSRQSSALDDVRSKVAGFDQQRQAAFGLLPKDNATPAQIEADAIQALLPLEQRRQSLVEQGKQAEIKLRQRIEDIEKREQQRAEQRVKAGESYTEVLAETRNRIKEQVELQVKLEKKQSDERKRQLDDLLDREKQITREVDERLKRRIEEERKQFERQKQQVDKLAESLRGLFSGQPQGTPGIGQGPAQQRFTQPPPTPGQIQQGQGGVGQPLLVRVVNSGGGGGGSQRGRGAAPP
ncbi:hypothetical protein Pan216_37090 [Planctomycetes bacterium Pan216]|uniref:Uncharacterized protein n=1 Tax=Kolteria novifilia TaxID=2527975 RepID=A0A518B781_9BACT|nr:hypothetical protein Pan216_37090 [Planctomycetes bacterium Pan216]